MIIEVLVRIINDNTKVINDDIIKIYNNTKLMAIRITATVIIIIITMVLMI